MTQHEVKSRESCAQLSVAKRRNIVRRTLSAAAIGVPFTYTLTSPVLFDPGTDTVINTVMLEDTPTNTPSTQFVNTAKRDFGTYEIATQ